MQLKSYVMDAQAIDRALKRISFEIAEKNKGYENICLVGIKRKGVPLANIIADFAKNNEDVAVPVGAVDITMYRDDINKAADINAAQELGFDINGKSVILVDDVIYTGRTVRAAIDALFAVGRPASVQLAVLIDRGHRELPIRPDYIGKNIPTSKHEIIKVALPEFDGETSVGIYTKE